MRSVWLLVLTAVLTQSADAAESLARRGCADIARRVDAVPGAGPLFLRSYENRDGGSLPEPALADSAFTYDNALAVIALVACGETERARQVGDALAAAVRGDRFYTDGRVRNAYRAGAVTAGAPLPPGWWSAVDKRWAEDPYQVGTATGNAVWAALALLTLHEATGNGADLRAAARLMGWVADRTADSRGPGGYMGGFHGHEPAPTAEGWKSTEHNIDAVAAFRWLARLTGEPRWTGAADRARRFLDALWETEEGHFLIGTAPDGMTPSRQASGLDAQLWPLLAVEDAPADWARSVGWAERMHGVDGGFDFNGDRDGVWVEGTAQAALTMRALGRGDDYRRLLAEVAKETAPAGLLFATRGARLTTGLAVGPGAAEADFFYYRHPHLGATAWGVLAATGWNPFTGRVLPPA